MLVCSLGWVALRRVDEFALDLLGVSLAEEDWFPALLIFSRATPFWLVPRWPVTGKDESFEVFFLVSLAGLECL